MSVSNYLSSLLRKYKDLNALIHEELSRPRPDSLVLFRLKLKRLQLKEKIRSLA
jgi:hypothetical protein